MSQSDISISGNRYRLWLSEGELSDLLHCIEETSIAERPRPGLAKRLRDGYLALGGDPDEFNALVR